MLNQRIKPRFVWSSVLFLSVLVIALISKNAGQPSPIHGEPPPEYTLTLNADNAPTTSSTFTEASQTVRYTTFTYENVKFSAGNHVELDSYGYFHHYGSQITSITGVTATFTSEGTFSIDTTFDGDSRFQYDLTSGVRKELPALPYRIEFFANGFPVILESVIITYTCIPHDEPLDQYIVTWYDEDGETVLEKDIDVEPNSMPSYDGPTPTKTYDPYGETFFTFSGWDTELGPVTRNTFYCATYAPYYASYALINAGTEYELRNVSDNTLTSISIPSTYNGLPVTSISEGVFEKFSELTTVNLPDTLTNIGDGAFYQCLKLTEIAIPQNVSNIGFNAFGGCSSFTGYTVSASNLTYSSLNGVLFNIDQTQLLSFPAGKGVTTYAIPDDVTALGDFAFVGNSVLESVSFPASLTTIGNGAFIACSDLNNVVLPDTVSTIGTGAFVNCVGLTSITLPSGMTQIPESFFYGCESLSSITLPSGITLIDLDAFYGCASLTTINVPSGLTSIGQGAFYGCTLLPNVTLPEGLLTIGSSAFSDCDTFTSVTLPASVTSIGASALSECANLTAINVDSMNTSYSSLEGVLFDEDLATLMCYPAGKTDTTYMIPSSVTTINTFAFRSNTYLTSVIIPDTVTTIAASGFYTCPNVTLNAFVSEKPAGWDDNWNASARPVVWGYVE